MWFDRRKNPTTLYICIYATVEGRPLFVSHIGVLTLFTSCRIVAFYKNQKQRNPNPKPFYHRIIDSYSKLFAYASTRWVMHLKIDVV